eukprot:5166246-Pyramimonas_sp.AAC.1
MAGNHWNPFGDIRRVRLSNPELRTLSAAPTRSAKSLVLFPESSLKARGFKMRSRSLVVPASSPSSP